MARRITATQLARSLRRVLDSMSSGGEEVVIIRNKQLIARIVPGISEMTALEAMADLYQTISPEAGESWVKDSRKAKKVLNDKIINAWDS